MKIRGREIHFLRTVQATADLVEICPDKDIERIGELFSGDLASTLKNGAKLIHFLSKGYEMNRAFSEDGYKAKPITIDEVMYLTQEEYQSLLNEAMASMNNGAEQMVELEETKKNEVNAESD